MEQNETKGSISIADLWEIFITHIWQIVLIGLLVFAILVGYSVFTYSAVYKSTATVYIIRQSDDDQAQTPTSSDFSLALNTVNDCTLLLKSHRVLDVVIEELGMEISYEQLRNMITINNPSNTRYLEISVTAPTPSDAKIIVDKLCEVGSESIVKIMGINQVNQVDQGTFPQTPANTMIGTSCYVGALGAAVLVYIVYLIIFMLDDKVSTPDDIEKYLGMSVLGLIPHAQDGAGSKYGGKYGRYGRYGDHTTIGTAERSAEDK